MKRVQETMGRLKRKGVREEQLALTLHVSHSAVMKWKSGTRCPKSSTIKTMELMFGAKIL